MRRLVYGIVALAASLVVSPGARAQEDESPAEWAEAAPDAGGKDGGSGKATIEELYAHPRAGQEALKIRSGDYALSVNLNAQVQAAFFAQEDCLIENWDPATTEGFRLRRGRLGFHGSAHEWVTLNLVLDLYEQDAGGNTVHAANIVLKPWSWLNAALGTAPLPFSKGAMTSSSLLQMIERPVTVTQMTPASQLGAALFGNVLGGVLEYGAGVYNGGPGLTKADRGEGLLYAGRLQVSPLGPVDSGESDLVRSPLGFSVGGGGYYNNDSSIETWAAGGDVRLKWKGLSLLGEVLWDRREPAGDPAMPPTLPDTTQRLGYFAQAGYFVIPGWLELAARYEWYDDRRDMPDATDLWLATGGANLFLLDGLVKVQINYIHRDEWNGPEQSNDIVFGQLQVNL
jgi:hypothetical protein